MGGGERKERRREEGRGRRGRTKRRGEERGRGGGERKEEEEEGRGERKYEEEEGGEGEGCVWGQILRCMERAMRIINIL